MVRTTPFRSLWFTVIIGGLGAFMILAVLASWVLRDQIFQTFLDPGVPYQTYELPPAPDYTRVESWARRPDPALLESEPLRPAVFFVHPTTYDGGDEWNAPFDRPQEAEELSGIILPNYAAPLTGDGLLFVPHYRQASLYAFMNNREDSQAARLQAFEDVRRAFARFRAEIGEDRPFIIAGLGQQGGLHALGVILRDIAPDEAFRHRMAAAYLQESIVPLDLFEGPLASLPPCASPEQVRCVIAFASVEPDEQSRVDALLDRGMSWTSDGSLSYVEDRGTLCVNPLLGTNSEDFAPARLHQGGAAAEGLEPGDEPSPLASQTGAQCQNGLLMIETPRSRALRRPHRLGEDRRVPPFNLFYVDIREDAARRGALLSAILAEKARYAPPLEAIEEIEVSPVEPIDPQ